jgi:hypothetical protein
MIDNTQELMAQLPEAERDLAHVACRALRDALSAVIRERLATEPEMQVIDVCQFPERGAESIYMLLDRGPVVRVRIDTASPAQAEDFMRGEPGVSMVDASAAAVDAVSMGLPPEIAKLIFG